MKITKENMIKMLGKMIQYENENKYNTPFDNEHDVVIYKKAYEDALKNVLYAISVNGE